MRDVTSPSLLRAHWIEDADAALRKLFESKGHKVPKAVRTAIGWPKGTRGGDKKILGQCWALEASTDAHSEVFLNPELGHDGKPTIANSMRILGVMAHEFAHAVAGNKAGHRKPFQIVIESIGLEGKATEACSGREFDKWAKVAVEKIGRFPSGALSNVSGERKKQSTRMLKCECPECGYVTRTSKKWIESAGPTICPKDNISLVCDAIDEEDNDD